MNHIWNEIFFNKTNNIYSTRHLSLQKYVNINLQGNNLIYSYEYLRKITNF